MSEFPVVIAPVLPVAEMTSVFAISDSVESQLPPKPFRILVSILLVVLFAIILAAITGAGSGEYAPPVPCQRASEFFRPIAAPLMLDGHYRFFAPDPGIDPVLWTRLSLQDGTACWFEWPPIGKSRDLKVPMRWRCIPRCACDYVPSEDGKGLVPVPIANILLSSYARHISQYQLSSKTGSSRAPVATIEYYAATHHVMAPHQARDGWDHFDLRLYDFDFLGVYTTAGERLGPKYVSKIPAVQLAATFIEDIRPLLNTSESAKVLVRLQNEGAPLAICRFLEKRENLFHVKGAPLAAMVKQAIEGG
jgi:hypothetical protein